MKPTTKASLRAEVRQNATRAIVSKGANCARVPIGAGDEVLRSGRRVLVGIVTNSRGEKTLARHNTSRVVRRDALDSMSLPVEHA